MINKLSTLIEGVKSVKLNQISVEGGNVLHAIKKSDEDYIGFGEIYFSEIFKDHIKGWKKHSKMTMNLVVVLGEIKIVISDQRVKSPTFGLFNEFLLSKENNYRRISIEPGLHVAFKGVSEGISQLMNFSNIEHCPDEVKTIKLDKIKYDW